MSSGDAKQALFAEFARVGRALGHGNRLALLELLAQGERGVEALARAVDLSVANASQHLQQLRRAGLVTTRRQGQHVLYRLSDDAVVDLLATLRRVAESNLAAVDQLIRGYFEARDSFDAVTPDELLRRLRGGGVTVLDVRPPEEFAAGHLPGAVNVPLQDLARRLSELPRKAEVVAYCRGPYCLMAYEAVTRLRKRGMKARRLENGFPEWKLAGLPVETGAV